MSAGLRYFREMNKPVFSIGVRRWWIVVLGLWACGYYLTESPHPLRQIGGVLARLPGGEKYHRTVREEETSFALFHMDYAARSSLSWRSSLRKSDPRVPYPGTWRQLLLESMDYAGPHMSGTLIEMFPFLIQPKDPWGNPWVCRVVEFGRRETSEGKSEVDLEITFGSLGPDGKECPKKYNKIPHMRHDTINRQQCDDLLTVVIFLCVESDLAPPGIPFEERELSRDDKTMN